MPGKFDIVSVGGAVRDITFYTNKGRLFRTPENLTAQQMVGFEYGAKIHIHEAHYTHGGGAVNTSSIAATLGLKSGIIARVGKDEDAESIIRNLHENGVDTAYVQKDRSTTTGTSFIVSINKKEKEHVVFTHRGANDFLEITPQAKNIRTKWFYISSLCGPNWLKSLRTICQYAKANDSKVAWNPGNIQLQTGKNTLEKIFPMVDLLILNKDEAIELVLSGIKIGSRNPDFLNKTVYLLNMLKEWGSKSVVITEGAKGASALENERVIRTKAHKIQTKKILDTTGIGDAFGATLVSGVIRGKTMEESLRMAAINSAHVLKEVGAHKGALSMDQLEK